MAKKGFTASHDFGSNCVVLWFGESEVARWPVPPNTKLDTQWEIDRFTARKLGSILDAAETALMDVEDV